MNKKKEIAEIDRQINDLSCSIRQCSGAVWDCEHVRHVIIEKNTFYPREHGYKKATPFCSKCGRCGQPRNPEKTNIPKNIAQIDRTQVDAMKKDTLKRKEFASLEIEQLNSIRQKLHEQLKDEETKRWWLNYNKYLDSSKWKKKRELIIERDKVCQSCLNAPIQEIHHLTYRHVFNEPLFDLIGVCTPCHKTITEMDRNQG